jgi:hypothetical protein
MEKMTMTRADRDKQLEVSELIGRMLFHSYHIGNLKVIHATTSNPFNSAVIDRSIELHEEKVIEFKNKILQSIIKE